MEQANLKTQRASRIARHRKKVATSGAKRVEVTVPSRDAPLVKAIAGALRSDGEEAKLIRQSLQPMLAVTRAKTGSELVTFLRASPLTDSELVIQRDRFTGRSAQFK